VRNRAVGLLVAKLLGAHQPGDRGKQPRVGLGVVPDVIAVAVAAPPFATAALPAAKVAVVGPETRLRPQDGHLGTDPVQQPVRQVRFVERVVVEPGLARQLTELGSQFLGYGKRVGPNHGVHVPRIAPLAAAVRAVGEMPGEEEGNRPLRLRFEDELDAQRAVDRLAGRRRPDTLRPGKAPLLGQRGGQLLQAFPRGRRRTAVADGRQGHVAPAGRVLGLGGRHVKDRGAIDATHLGRIAAVARVRPAIDRLVAHVARGVLLGGQEADLDRLIARVLGRDVEDCAGHGRGDGLQRHQRAEDLQRHLRRQLAVLELVPAERVLAAEGEILHRRQRADGRGLKGSQHGPARGSLGAHGEEAVGHGHVLEVVEDLPDRALGAAVDLDRAAANGPHGHADRLEVVAAVNKRLAAS